MSGGREGTEANNMTEPVHNAAAYRQEHHCDVGEVVARNEEQRQYIGGALSDAIQRIESNTGPGAQCLGLVVFVMQCVDIFV